MRTGITLAALLAAQLASLASALPALANGKGLGMYGLSEEQHLVFFREGRTSRAREIGPIALSGDARLVGIDFRPATGALFGLGDAGGVYEIDTQTGAATLRSRLNVNGAPLALAGAAFGVDFNPTVDRLRVVSDAGQNLRVNVDTGATTEDPLLNNAGATATGITGAAYTNNDADPNTATTLFDLDAALDQIAIQAPPNAGTQNATGKLGLDVAPEIGFDIYSVIDDDGTTAGARAFATITTDRTRLYAINLLTGRARAVGAFREEVRLIGLAIPPNQE
jgi:hypothetical protein